MSELWDLVWGKPQVDPALLSKAIEREIGSSNSKELDVRTQLLIRDGTKALELFWGRERLNQWLDKSPVRDKIEALKNVYPEERGFPLLKERLMDKTKPEDVKRFLRELATCIHKPLTLEIGGSIALILTGYLTRGTEDIDVVNELPEAIRNQHELLHRLKDHHHLLLTHFQSHYLPSGWEDRLNYFGNFGSLQVYTVDVYDIFLCKLFSARAKDFNDLKVVMSQLDKNQIVNQLLATCESFLKDPKLKELGQKNWYILFGEGLPGIDL